MNAVVPIPSERSPRSNLSAIATSLGVLAALGLFAAAMTAKAVVVPTLLALLLALALSPIAGFLERLRIPAAIAATVTVLSASAAIAFVATTAAPLFADLVEDAPKLVEALDRRIRPIRESLQNVGDATEEIGTIVAPDGAEKAQPVKIVGASPTQTALRVIPTTLAQFFYVALLAGFVLAGRRSYRMKLIAAASSIPGRLRIARIIRDIGEKVSGYLFVLSLINVFDGIAVAIAFAALGLPDPILWGAAFGIGNFAPVVGPAAVIIASGLVGFATQETVIGALSGPLAMLAINIFEGNLLQPLLMARRTVVNPLAIFVSFALFAWMWGPAATLLAVPIIVCFAVVARHTPGLRPLAVMLTNEEPQRGRLAALIRASRKPRPPGTTRSPKGLRKIKPARPRVARPRVSGVALAPTGAPI